MRNRSLPLFAAAVGAAILLAGCAGQPETFVRASPIVLNPHVAVRAPARPASLAPKLSKAEKERLFREFQRMQALKAPMVTVEGGQAP